MLILTVITFSFVRIVSRAFIEINNHYYISQAHYAAESALNDVRAEIHKQLIRASQEVDDSGVEVEKTDNSRTKVSGRLATLSLTDGAHFGQAVSVYENLLIVGALLTSVRVEFTRPIKRQIHIGFKQLFKSVYEDTLGTNLQAGDKFGSAVFLDKGVLAVGAPGDDDGGN